MASWMIHLRVADRLMDKIRGLDATAFVMGNIAPDSGMPNADWTAYSPPKAVSHYKTHQHDETFFDLDRFISEHLTAEQIRAYSRREFSFFLGYYVHLLTDADWTLKIFRPMIAEYVEKRGEDKHTFIWKMKQDWYDLDFRYLEEHPDFRAYHLYEQASGFSNDFMDIFSKDAFDNRREYICGFYRGRHGELYREYPFLTPARADAFVGKTVEVLLVRLTDVLAIRNEKSTLCLKDLQPSRFYISEKKLQDVRIQIKPVTKENLDAVLALKVSQSQTGFVSTTAEALAQAYVYAETAFPFAVYSDREIVGFIMMGYYEEKQYYTLWKLLIDQKYQGLGYGKAALNLGIAFLKERFRAARIYTGVIPGNLAAKSLYQSVGFESTGLFENGMEELCLKC